MKNPEIELVKKHLADPKSVSVEELERAAAAANAAAKAVANIGVYAAFYVAVAAFYAVTAAARADTAAAKYWIKEYEDLKIKELKRLS